MLTDRLTQDLKDAMRQKDAVRLGAIRMLRSALTEKEKEAGEPVSDDEATTVVQRQVKQRRDSIRQFEDAGRDDLAERERAELAVLEAYLPEQASDDEVEAVVRAAVERAGATSMQDMGRVMGPAMGQLKGKADGNRVRAAVERALKGGGAPAA